MKEKHGEYIAIYWEDDCDIEYVRGHVTLAEARAALEFGCGKGCGDFAHSVTHRWARWQPAPRGSDFDSLFVARDDQARGCFAVTEVKLGKKMAPDGLGPVLQNRGNDERPRTPSNVAADERGAGCD